MNILKAIGNLFIRLWRWIKETAWVQPLLIVGAIFAVIFSIPRFTEWINSIQAASASRYWAEYKKTLQGENDKINEFNTEADKLTQSISEWSNLDGEYKTYAEWEAGMTAKLNAGSLDVNMDPRTTYGKKFFMIYVSNDCANCDEMQPAFEELSSSWNVDYPIEGTEKYAIHTIFTDDESDNDDTYDLEEDKKAFVRYLDKFEENDFLASGGGRLQNAPYKINKSVDDSNYNYFINGDHSGFKTPTILLIDFTEEAFNRMQCRIGISEVLFGVSGADKYAKAANLAYMWNHNTETDTSNPFSDVYESAK